MIVVLEDGTLLLDWEDGLGVDLLNSEFIHYDKKCIVRTIQDAELETLRRAGRVVSFDHRQVNLTTLPEMPRRDEA